MESKEATRQRALWSDAQEDSLDSGIQGKGTFDGLPTKELQGGQGKAFPD